MQKLQSLLNDSKIQNYYQLADESKFYHAEHNLSHALRVMELCQIIATQLNLADHDVENVCIAGLLHDIGASNFGKKNHAERSFEFAHQYTQNVDILNAIRYHSHGHPSTYGYILTLADKLDICRNRVTELGATITGVRQFLHFTALTLEIKNNCLTIQITSDQQTDWEELNDYYFVTKIFTAIKNFADYFKLTYQVLVDNQPWQITPTIQESTI